MKQKTKNNYTSVRESKQELGYASTFTREW